MYQQKVGRSPAQPRGPFDVLLEVRTGSAPDPARALQIARTLDSCELDASYEPVQMSAGTVILRCRVRSRADMQALQRHPDVVAVWMDTPIAPMDTPQL